MRLREPIPGLFVSGHTIGLAPEQVLAIIGPLGIGRVVCLTPLVDSALEARMQALGLRYDHASFADAEITQPDMIRALARGIADADARTLVHCREGRNRSFLVAALVMVYRGWEPAAAVARCRELRGSALTNQHFVEFILRSGKETDV